MNQSDISRIIEMAWEDRTPFDAIESQYGLNEQGVKRLMRNNLKSSSYKQQCVDVFPTTPKYLKLIQVHIDGFCYGMRHSFYYKKLHLEGCHQGSDPFLVDTKSHS